ncbi:major facilitator superfamily domain-containing protein [Mortierella sp. GBAus27b]|nr:hypothetical protein BGX31_005852 [Mortierella sp. GBA43]KAI8358004.1 major facilitator superfamily domain-containing protein [Mortierella sp. GBAus27b]
MESEAKVRPTAAVNTHPDPETTVPCSNIPPPADRKRLFRIFIVEDTVSYLNFVSYLIACFAAICLVAYLSLIQPFVLNIVLGITENTGSITGSLALYDEIIALPATLIWGILSDRVGRRPVYSIGFACLGISLILYPYVKNVYPHMLLCRLLFSVGSAACTCMMTGTLGDIAGNHRERGRVSAIVGLFAAFGGMVAGLGLIKLHDRLGAKAGSEAQGIRLSLTIVGACALGLALTMWLILPRTGTGAADGLTSWFKNRISRRRDEPSNDRALDEQPLKVISPWKMLKYGVLAARDPRIGLAYLTSFVSRADTVLFTSFISLWVIQYFVDHGSCNGTDNDSCSQASTDTHRLTGIGQGVSLIWAPIIGYLGEAFDKSSLLAFSGVVGAVGSLPFAFTQKAPADKSNLVFVSLIGMGQIGMIVTGMTLVNGVHTDPKYRGSIAGVFSFCGAVSIMFMARLGGHLFDEWMHGAPFVLMGIAHLLVALMSVYVRIVTPRLERQDMERLKAKEEAMDQDTKTKEESDRFA